MLTEGQTYEWQGDLLMAVRIAGRELWLRTLDWEPGGVVAYRPTSHGWRECRFAQTPAGEELIVGAPVDLDLDALLPVDEPVDERFLDLMGELGWEWTR